MLGADNTASDKIAMSDSATPQNSEPDGTQGSPLGEPPSASPQPPGQSPAPSALEQSTKGGSQLTTPPGSSWLGRVKHLAQGRNGVWAAAAVLCLAAGTVGSVLGARAVARTDAAKARLAFPRTSAEIASTLKASIQHEEDLVISATTFFAGNPKASAREFDAWAKWTQPLRRYPELDKLGLVAFVRAPELAEFEARITGHAVKPITGYALKPLGTRSATSAVAGFRIIPAGTRPSYCFRLAELARNAAKSPPAGFDYCATTSGLLSSLGSGLTRYAPVSVGQAKGSRVETPVYRGSVPPATVVGRRGAFVGWLREVLVPGVVLDQALQGHSDYAAHLRYRTGSSNVVFASGTPQPGAQTTATDLHNGWTVRSFGPPAAATGVLADGNALALLIVGILLSALLGVLVFLLGSGRSSGPVRETRKRAHDDLYDPLTGLPNRALMLDRAERMLARAGRQSGLLVGALFIDIDWFKDVNEKLGQAAGDQLLTIVSERLESVVRAHDTVGRLGGDEFVVLVESAARGVRLDSLARRVIEALHKTVELDGFGPSFALTASIGVAFGRYETPEDLLRDAQLALHAARAAGRDRYTLFNANMRSVIEGRGVLEVELNAALQEKQFLLLYQPVYDLTTQKVVGLEALIRWQHPTQGILPPDDFIPLAEETGLIVPIGRWALEEACIRAASWNVAGSRAGISVKVSANQLNRDGFSTDVRRALQQSGLDPSLLTLEIPEIAVMHDLAAAAERLEEIKRLGVRIAIDDFGSGYAHHADLKRMPLDFLKVDRSSLAASDDEDYRSWLLQAILIVGRDLSLPVIATGIETYEQLTTLQAMGFTMAQGFFLGKPTPTDAVEGLFDAKLPTAAAEAEEHPAPTEQIVSHSAPGPSGPAQEN
jgi:diguanylate cyclase (GGDEF)-like protein